jgi:protein O-GlcNAc transferase
MDDVHERYATAVGHHRAGRRAQATTLLHAIVAAHPEHAEAVHQLGLIAYEENRFDLAEQLFRRAADAAPSRASYQDHLGNALKAKNQLDAATECYRKALAIDPTYGEAGLHLGNTLLQQQRARDAELAYRTALIHRPQLAAIHTGLGRALAAQGLHTAAIEALETARVLDPGDTQSAYSLGNALHAVGRTAEAVASYDRAIAGNPRLAFVHHARGEALGRLERYAEAIAAFEQATLLEPASAAYARALGGGLFAVGRLSEALPILERAVVLDPAFADAQCGLGLALERDGRFDEALIHLDRALELDGMLAEAHAGRGLALAGLGRRTEAVPELERACELRPRHAAFRYELGNILRSMGRIEASIAAYGEAVAIDRVGTPAFGAWVHERQMICAWHGLDESHRDLVDAIRTRGLRVSPFAMLSVPASPEVLHTVSERWSSRIHRPSPLAAGRRTRGDRLRIGYLSADLREHPVAMLAADLFEAHDRARFEILGFSYGHDDGGAMRKRLPSAFDRFFDLERESSSTIARTIHREGVDILVDLTGFTGRGRPRVVAARPAPLQAQWMGIAASMGTPAIDYTFVDRWVVPLDEERHFTEKLVYLPGSYQVNSRSLPIGVAPTRAECGLPADAFVFASFNHTYKILPIVFDVWMRLLAAVPASVLWVVADALAAANLKREAAARGVDPSRLVVAERVPMAAHLARHACADLFMDTLPYTAHGTASHALWAGLPVLTCTGSAFQGRVAGSLLRRAGLSDLVMPDLAAYEATALRLARDPAELRRVRARVAAARDGALFDTARFARNLERAFEEMWDVHASGKPPRRIEVADVGEGA